jgi:hypothetical protein
MAIVNKRNAVVGWITLKVGRKVGKHVARNQAKVLVLELRRKLPGGHK